MRLVAIIVFCWLLLTTIDGIGSLGGRKNETRGFNKTGGNFFRYSFFFFFLEIMPVVIHLNVSTCFKFVVE